MTYSMLLNQAYAHAVRLPQLSIIDDLAFLTVIELDCAINIMLRMLDN